MIEPVWKIARLGLQNRFEYGNPPRNNHLSAPHPGLQVTFKSKETNTINSIQAGWGGGGGGWGVYSFGAHANFEYL